MNNEIESLYATLGMTMDDATVTKSVNEMVDTVQKKLQSSIYGDQKGVITIPATIEGKYKNGKEIEKEIKDAYADIYEKARKMADSGVSLTLKDVEDFKNEIDKFGKLTARKRGNDVIANLNNNLQQTLASYQDLVNSLQQEISVVQKQQTKLTRQNAKKNQSAKTTSGKRKGYIDTGAAITTEEIESDIKNRQKRILKGIKSVLPNEYSSGWIDPGRTNPHEAKKSEVSFYGSRDARQTALSRIEARRTFEKESLTIDKYATKEELELEAERRREEDKKIAMHPIEGKNKNKFSDEEKAYMLSEDIRNNILPKILEQLQLDIDEKDKDRLIQKFSDTLDVISTLNKTAGKLLLNEVKKTVGIAMGTVGFTTTGHIGGTEGEDKTSASRNPKVEAALQKLLDKVSAKEEDIIQELIRLEQIQEQSKSKSKIEQVTNSFANRLIAEAHTMNTSQKQNSENITQAVSKDQKAVEKQTDYDKIEHSAERVADSAAGKKNQDIIKNLDTDLNTGFNTDANANRAIESFSMLENLKDMMCPCKEVLDSILAEVQTISKNGVNINDKQKGQTRTKSSGNLPVPVSEVKDHPITDTRPTIKFGISEFSEQIKYAGAALKNTANRINEEVNQSILKHATDLQKQASGSVPKSSISTTVKDPHSWVTKLKDTFADLTKTTANYKVIMAKTSEEQDRMAAERIKQFGLSRNGDPTGQGDKISIARRLSLFRGKDRFKDLFGDINLSEGIKVDTTDLTNKLAKVLSGPEMFKAQTGGWKNNLTAAATGGLSYLWQPSLEKSRAQIDGVNTIMSNIRTSFNQILQDIQDKESKLRGMQSTGELKLGVDGKVLDSSSTAAKTLALSLEESKQALASVLADVGMVDQVVGRSHGKVSKIVQLLGFTSPILRKNNSILANLNAGLDKTGKALKYQTRAGEILNYSFQLMGRHVGQIVKNLMLTLNPINLIKRAFNDFASYDTKWQRTMNVIKYNLRRILKPFMEWLAQQLVNILGIINAIIKGIGQAFGKDWDLFDQSAANEEKLNEELDKTEEKLDSITAGFDELHDISGELNKNDKQDENSADNLLGEIYKPEWGDLYNTITEKAKAITEKLIPIFKKLGDIFKWCLDHWQLLVAAWAAFKIAKNLWKLIDWAHALKAAFGKLNLIKLTNLTFALLGILGIIQTMKGVWDAIDWSIDWGGMLPDERKNKGDKAIKETETGMAAAGASMGWFLGKSVAGIPGAIAGTTIGALIGDGMGEAAIGTFNTIISAWHGDTEGTSHFAKKAGEGMGKTLGTAAGTAAGVWTATKVGAALGTSFGPIGTAVGAVLGAAIGWAAGGVIGKKVGVIAGNLLNGIQNITRGKGAFQKLKVSAEDVENAMKLVNEKTTTYNKTLSELQTLEQQTGESGKALYEAVENGAKSYDALNEAQKKVYDKYQEMIQAETELYTAKKQNLEYSAKYQEQLGKESGDFTKYIETMQKGIDEGLISQKDMYNYFAQTYGSLDADAKKVFVEQLPAYMRQSIKDQGVEYETFGNKVLTTFSDMGNRIVNNNKSIITSIKQGWETGGIIGAIAGVFEGIDTIFAKSSNGLKLLSATEDDVKASTEALAKAQEEENKLQKEVDELQIRTKSSAEELYNKLNDGTITYQNLTSDQQLLVNKYAELQEAMAKTDEFAKKNVENIASVDLQAATTTGNYDTFISNLMAANERGEISTDEMYNLMSQAYADMDRKARESFENQANEHGLMVDTIRTKSDEYLGIMGTLKKNLGNIWTDIKKGITQKAQEIWSDVTSKFQNLKDELGRKWEAIKTGASQGWQNIKDAIWGWVKSLWDSITKVFENIGKAATDLWQKVCNFFSGKGFKTNEQVESDGNRNVSIQPYAAGTNYVPMDGLAYLHKGEAVIPAKYNNPYQQNDNRRLEESINQLNQQVAQIGDLVNQGINVHGQFVQKGTDLVASVEKSNNKLSNTILSNKVYAR